MTFKTDDRKAALADILVGIVDPDWNWSIGPGVVYKLEVGKINKDVFRENETILDGHTFLERITTNKHYIIFADFKAFPHNGDIQKIIYYDDFVTSSCDLALLVIDSVYISIFLKSEVLINMFFERAEAFGFKDIKILTDENDTHPSLTVYCFTFV
ncbi:MAG: DUF2691 family protein [Solibacillus sp.]